MFTTLFNTVGWEKSQKVYRLQSRKKTFKRTSYKALRSSLNTIRIDNQAKQNC